MSWFKGKYDSPGGDYLVSVYKQMPFSDRTKMLPVYLVLHSGPKLLFFWERLTVVVADALITPLPKEAKVCLDLPIFRS